MNDEVENPYKTPSADLVENGSEGSIERFARFSAWGVFGLSIITLGIYPIYWLYSRSKVANSIHENPIPDAWLIGLVVATVLSFASGLLGSSTFALVVSLIVTVAYIVTYLGVLFKLRNRLQDIMDRESQTGVKKIGPIMTFFFNAIYLQYKINECIDTRSGRKS